MATAAAFARMPEEVWRWYLFRRGVCRAAAPNAAHLALVRLEQRLGERFLLVTQNVDGLHLRAGNSPERTYQIHGNIDFCRCIRGCPPAVRPMPAALAVDWPKERSLTDAELGALRCDCGDWLRPHVLWFDESYDEPRYRVRLGVARGRDGGGAHRRRDQRRHDAPGAHVRDGRRARRPLHRRRSRADGLLGAGRESARGQFLRGSASAVLPSLIEELGRQESEAEQPATTRRRSEEPNGWLVSEKRRRQTAAALATSAGLHLLVALLVLRGVDGASPRRAPTGAPPAPIELSVVETVAPRSIRRGWQCRVAAAAGAPRPRAEPAAARGRRSTGAAGRAARSFAADAHRAAVRDRSISSFDALGDGAKQRAAATAQPRRGAGAAPRTGARDTGAAWATEDRSASFAPRPNAAPTPRRTSASAARTPCSSIFSATRAIG